MKLIGLISCTVLIEGKVSQTKGALSVSHRSNNRSRLPVQIPEANDVIPDFIITGVNKCGTSAAARFLYNHPDLDRASGEPNFFNLDENYNKGFAWYGAQFPNSTVGDNKLLFEKTPSYYKSADVQKRIKAMNPNIKLVNIGKHKKPQKFDILPSSRCYDKRADFILF